MDDRRLLVRGIVVAGIAWTFYWITSAPDVIWGDSASLAIAAAQGPSFSIHTAGDHPLFVLIGSWLAPLPGSPARHLTLLSGFFAAMTVANVYWSAAVLGTRPFAAAVGAAALAVSHAFWLHAVIPEVYTANTFFLTATILLLLEWRARRRWFPAVAAMVCFLAGLTNHLVLAALAPAALVFVALTIRQRPLSTAFLYGLIILVVALAAALPWRESIVTAAMRVWLGPPGIAEYFTLSLDVAGTLKESGYYLLYLLYQFPTIAVVLAPAGTVVLWRRDRAAAVLITLAIVTNAAIFINHTRWQSPATSKYVFYISDYALAAVFVAAGTDAAVRWMARAWPIAPAFSAAVIAAWIAMAPPVMYAAAPAVNRRLGMDLVGARSLSHRDSLRYFLNPDKRGETGPREFGEAALAAAAPGGVIFTDYTPATVLRYLQLVDGLHPDVLVRGPSTTSGMVRPEPVCADGKPRRIFVVRNTPDYDWTRWSGLHVLTPAGPIFEVKTP